MYFFQRKMGFHGFDTKHNFFIVLVENVNFVGCVIYSFDEKCEFVVLKIN